MCNTDQIEITTVKNKIKKNIKKNNQNKQTEINTCNILMTFQKKKKINK